jgi:hypothetical protein
MSDDRSQPGEVSGLSKIEAEDLLDRLEATGCELCHLVFVEGEGFKIRPEGVRAEGADVAENKTDQSTGESIGSLSACS